jgi:hypothetical protein
MSDFDFAARNLERARFGTAIDEIDIERPRLRSDLYSMEKARFGSTINELNQKWLAERRSEIADFYSVRLSQNDYDILSQYLTYSQDPELSTARFQKALAVRKVFRDLDLSTILRDLENIEIAEYGKPLPPKWNFGQAVLDNAVFSKNMVDESNLYAELYKIRKMAGNDYAMLMTYGNAQNNILEKNILDKINILKEENQKLLERMPTPQNWLQEAVKYGTQGIVQSAIPSILTLVGSAAGSPLLGGALSGAYLYNISQGQAYGNLIERGFSHDVAGKTSIVVGLINAGIEMGLDATIGRFAGVDGNVTAQLTNKITSAITNKLHYSGWLNKTATILTHIGVGAVMGGASEGLEEALQELTTWGGEYAAQELGKEFPQLGARAAQEFGKDLFESIKGGVIGGMVLGGLGGSVSGITNSINVDDALKVQDLAQTVTNQTEFNEATSGFFNDNEIGKRRQREVFDEGQKSQVKVTEQDIIDTIKYIRDSGKTEPTILDEQGNLIETGTEYRNNDGKLNTYSKAVNGKSDEYVYVVSNKKNERYGRIRYTLNDSEGSITIKNFKMTEQRENIRDEFYDDFAREFAGYDIEWDTQSKVEQDIKDRLIAKNPNGERAELNYYNSYNNDAFTEKFVDKIKEVYKKGSIQENSVITALYKHQAELEGKEFKQWINDTFGGVDSMFTAKQPIGADGQPVSMKGKKGAVSFLAKAAGDAKAIIHLTEKSDFSTFTHELAHIARRHLSKEDQALADNLFVDEEDFANSYLKYYKDGVIEDRQAVGLFRRISQFLRKIADSIVDKIKLSPEKRQFFDKISQSVKGQPETKAQPAAASTLQPQPTENKAAGGKFDNITNRTDAIKIMREEAERAFRENNKRENSPTDIQQELKDDTDNILFQTDDEFVEDAMNSTSWEELQAKTEAIDPSDFAPLIAEQLSDMQDDDNAKREFYKVMWDNGQKLKERMREHEIEYRQKVSEALSWIDLRDEIESDLDTWYLAPRFERERLRLGDDPAAIDRFYQREWEAAQEGRRVQEIEQLDPEKADKLWIEEKFTDLESADKNLVQFLSSVDGFQEWFMQLRNADFDYEANEDIAAAPEEWKNLDREKLEEMFETAQTVVTHPSLRSAFIRINHTAVGNSKRDTLLNGSKDDPKATRYLRSIITHFRNHPREYRRVWSYVMQEPEWAVADNDSILAGLKEQNAQLENPLDLMSISPEQLTELSKKIRDEEIRESVAKGTITIDGMEHFIASLDKQVVKNESKIQEKEYAYKEYLNEQVQIYHWRLADQKSTIQKLKAKLENISDKERIKGTRRYIERLNERIEAGANYIKPIAGGGTFFDQDTRKYVHRKVDDIASLNIRSVEHNIEIQEEAIKENVRLVREIQESMNIKEVKIEADEKMSEIIKAKNEKYDRDMKELRADKNEEITAIRKEKNERYNTDMKELRADKNAEIALTIKAKNEKYNTDMQRLRAEKNTEITQTIKAKNEKYNSDIQKLKTEHKTKIKQLQEARKLKNQIKRLIDRILHTSDDIYKSLDTLQAKSIIGIRDIIKKNQEHFREQLKQVRSQANEKIRQLQEPIKQLRLQKQEMREAGKQKQYEIEELSQKLKTIAKEEKPAIKEQIKQAKEELKKIRQNIFKINEEIHTQAKRAKRHSKGIIRETHNNFEFTPLEIDQSVKETVRNVIGDELYSLIVKRPFKLWELTDLQNMAKSVKDLYQEGKENKTLKDEARRLLTSQYIKRVTSTVKSAGITERDSKHDIKRKENKMQQALKQNDFSKPGAKPNRLLQFLLFSYDTTDTARVARILDNQQQGVNYQLLHDMEDVAYTEKHTKLRERRQKMQELLKKSGLALTKEGLPKEIFAESGLTFDNYYNQREVFTIEKLLHMKAAASNEHSRNAIAHGHFLSEDERNQIAEAMNSMQLEKAEEIQATGYERYDKALQTIDEFFNRKENKKFLKVIDFIKQDYNEQYPRMNQFSIDEWGMPVEQVNDYLPMMRLASDGTSSDYDIWADLQATYDPNPGYVSKGRTISRKDIPPQAQSPIKLGIFSTWISASEQVEHFLAYSGYVRKLNSIYGKQTPASKALRENIQKRYGRGMLEFIDNFIAETAHPYKFSERTSIDNLISKFRGRLAPAYIAKISSIVMQAITSPPAYLIYVSPQEYASAAFHFALDSKNMKGLVDDMSVHMENRSVNIMYQLTQEQKARSTGSKSVSGKIGHAIDVINNASLEPLNIIDSMAVYPGWLAVYIKTVKELTGNKKFSVKDIGKTPADIHKAAIKQADDITRLIQPQTRKTDIAPLFKEGNELQKAFLQFQVALNTVWKTYRYDMPYHVAQKRVDRIFKTIIYYGLSNILLGCIRQGFDDDDELLDRVTKVLWWATTSFTDSIPVVSSLATATVGTVLTREDQFTYTTLSPSLPVVEQGTQAVRTALRGIRSGDEEDFARSARHTAELLGLSVGFPVSQTKEAVRAFDVTGDDEIPLWLELLGRRER